LPTIHTACSAGAISCFNVPWSAFAHRNLSQGAPFTFASRRAPHRRHRATRLHGLLMHLTT
ncbi:hypothetical protein NL526_28380, partial [Klebsiella pneumoniae]|nr:hypothetical protein [Klebsiella pneumoniae]